MLTLSKPNTADALPSDLHGARLVLVGPGRWRVVDLSGRAVGHVDAVSTAAGTRFHARRFHAPTRTFRDLGAFWAVGDAVDCLRLSR